MCAMQPVPLTWGRIRLSQVAMINGVPYATRRAIGEFLEYINPQNSIDNLIKRNPYIEEHSLTVKLLSSDGKAYQTRVYNPREFYTICIRSQTNKAKRLKGSITNFVRKYIKTAPAIPLDH